MSNGIDDLRKRLFETIDGVKSGAVSLEQARTVSELAQVIVNTAKVEVDYVRATDGRAQSKFLAAPGAAVDHPAVPGNAIAGVTQHLIRG